MIQLKADLSCVKTRSLGSLKTGTGAALVLGVTRTDDKSSPVKAMKGQKETEKAFASLTRAGACEGKAGETCLLRFHQEGLEDLNGWTHLMGFGVGQPKDCFPQNALAWGGQLARSLRDAKILEADVNLDSLYNPAGSAGAKDAPKDFAGRPHPGGIPTREEFLELLAIGATLGVYKFDRYKSKAKDADKGDKKPATLKIRFVSQFLDDKKAAEILARVKILAEAVYLMRDLQTTPANDLAPPELARQAQQAGREAGFSVTVWDEKKLKSEGMNGILAVGQASSQPPRLITMEHNPGKKGVPTLVFVGKGVTFDTGGVCIKPAAGMEEMKMDMSGSAAVIASVYAASKLKLPVRIVGLVAAAENMLAGNATRPGDIYTAHDGQTVEVINTDAEGRLVLADALSYAKTFKPDCVIDIATLTGAVIVALGNVSSGIMGNNAALMEGFRKASEKVGEKVWELPLYEEYQDDMRSKCADYRNSGDRGAGSQKGGTFLNFFVKDAYPWMHLDIAGTDIPKGQGAHCPPDVGSGIAVRALVEFARNFKSYF